MARTVLIALGLTASVATGGQLRSGAAAQDVADASALERRLGGTLASFEEQYGPPVELNVAIGAVFAVAGYGLVAAQFGWELLPTTPTCRRC